MSESIFDKAHPISRSKTTANRPSTDVDLSLTVTEMVRKSIESQICTTCRHVVHPKVFENGGLTTCGNCFELIYVPSRVERENDPDWQE